MEWPINIWIGGKPAKQGSKRVIPHVRKMRADGVLLWLHGSEWIRTKDIVKYTIVIDDDANNKAWREHVASTFNDISELIEPLDEPVFVVATFYRERPKSHFTSKGALSAEGLKHPKPDTRPDSFKMMRSVEDALSGIAWQDDSRICDHVIRKRWSNGMGEGVHLMIWPDKDCPVEVIIDS